MRVFRLAAVIGCAFALLGGCADQELYADLSEKQANEMVALLRSAGLEGDKQAREGHYSVLTSRADFSQAVRALNAQGYPREQFDSIGKIFKREGFVSSPLEERARLVFALSQEMSNTLANIDGVVTARVHLVVPERNPLVDKPRPAAASVFIKHRPDKDMTTQVAQIKALVVNSIEGLPYDNVTVALFPAESLPQVRPASPAEQQRSQLQPLLVVGALSGLALLGGGGFLAWRRRMAPRVGGKPDVALAARRSPLPPADGNGARQPSPTDFQAAMRRATGPR